MYQIKKENGESIFLYEPVFVKKQENGRYGICEKTEAEGIAIEGKIYPLSNVTVISEDAYRKIIATERENEIAELELAIAELSVAAAGGETNSINGVVNVWTSLIKKGKMTEDDVPNLNGLKEKVLFRLEGEQKK